MNLVLRIAALVIFVVCALAIWFTDVALADVLGLGFVGLASWVAAEVVGTVRA